MSPLSATLPTAPATPLESGLWRSIVRARTALVLGAFLLTYFALQVGVFTRSSATYDEPIHLMAGYAALARGDYRIDPTHPPLLRMWAALPLTGMENPALGRSRIDRSQPVTWLPQAYAQASGFLYDGPDPDRALNAGRLMVTLLGAVLGILVFYWAREWLGFTPAALALAGYLLEPNLGAHASLVTTDLGVTCFFFGAIYFLWRAGRRWSVANAAGAALCFALACVTKFSAVLLVPAGGLLLALMVARGTLTLRRAGALAGAAGCAAFLLVWAVYGFRYAPSATPGWLFRAQEIPRAGHEPLALAGILEWIDARHLLPNAFTQGFLLCTNLSQNLPAFLAGEISTDGWWYYFPVAFLLKTPAPLLLLAGVGAVVLVRHRLRLGTDNALFLFVPAALYLAAAMTTSINIGVRHILPVFPFVLLIAAAAVREICAGAWRPRTKWLVLGVLMAFWLDRFARVYPNTLTYFNAVAGGAHHGADYLVDSNLDWGQDLKPLKAWMDEQGLARINLAYFGTADPAHHGIVGVCLPGGAMTATSRLEPPELPGHVALSATLLSGVFLTPEWRLFYAGFKDLEPVAVIGNTINVYRVDAWPEVPVDAETPPTNEEIALQFSLALELLQIGWREQAISCLQRHLHFRPDSIPTHAYLGRELLLAGRKGEAAEVLQRAIALDPANGDFRGSLASVLLDLNELPAALFQAREFVRMQPGNPKAHDLLGVALGSAGRPAEAFAAFEEALRLAPNEPLFREHLELARSLKATAFTGIR